MLLHFDNSCKIDIESIKTIIKEKKQLRNIPILFNVDFGHIRPIATFLIGGKVKIVATEKSSSIEIIEHKGDI